MLLLKKIGQRQGRFPCFLPDDYASAFSGFPGHGWPGIPPADGVPDGQWSGAQCWQ